MIAPHFVCRYQCTMNRIESSNESSNHESNLPFAAAAKQRSSRAFWRFGLHFYSFGQRVRRLVSQVGATRVRLGLDGSLFLHHHMTKQKNSCTGIWSTCHVGGVRLLPWGCAAMPCALVGTSQPSSLAGINASLDVQCRTHIFSLMGHFVST